MRPKRKQLFEFN